MPHTQIGIDISQGRHLADNCRSVSAMGRNGLRLLLAAGDFRPSRLAALELPFANYGSRPIPVLDSTI